MGRSNLGYGGSRSSISSQDSHGLYSSRQGMSYGGGMFSRSLDVDHISWKYILFVSGASVCYNSYRQLTIF